MTAERTEYKGNKMLTLKQNENDKYPFSFGVKKARLIMDHLEDIQAFIEDNR